MSEDLTEKATETFLDKFHKDLWSQDPIYVVLRGHLYIESVINTILRNFLYDPKELDLISTPLKQKIKLLKAFGLIQHNIIPSIEKLARIRNKFSHTLWTKYEKSDETDFINIIKSCPAFSKYYNSAHGEWKKNKMACGIFSLWLGLHDQMIANAKNKKYLALFWENCIDAKNIDIENIEIDYFETEETS